MSRPKALHYEASHRWVKHPSGLVTPEGRQKQFLDYSQTHFLDIKAVGLEVEAMYKEAGINLNPTSSLHKLIDDSKLLADKWLACQVDESESSMLRRGCLTSRVLYAIHSLKNEPNSSLHLAKLGSGDLNLFSKGRTPAKDFFWEVEMFEMLKEHRLKPTFEEPDLSISILGTQIGVACKKIYSEGHIQNTLSSAVVQIERMRRPGIVAMNLDDLHALEIPISGPSYKVINQQLSDFNTQFIQRHERHLRKYLASSRIAVCMISSHHYGEATTEMPRLNNYSETTCWAIPNIGPGRQRISDAIFAAFNPIGTS